MTAIEHTAPRRALLDGNNDSARDRNLPIIRSTEQSSIIPNFGCDLIVFGDLGLVRYGVAQFHIV